MIREPLAGRRRRAPDPVRTSAGASGLVHAAVLAVALFGYPVLDIVWAPVSGVLPDALADGGSDRTGSAAAARAVDIRPTDAATQTVGGIDPTYDVPTDSTGEVGYTVAGDTPDPQTRAGKPDTKPAPPVVRTAEPARQGKPDGVAPGTSHRLAAREFLVVVTLRPDLPDRPAGSEAGRERIADADGTDDGQDARAQEARRAAAALQEPAEPPPAPVSGSVLPAPELDVATLPEHASGLRPIEAAAGPARPPAAAAVPKSLVPVAVPLPAPRGTAETPDGRFAAEAPRGGGVPAPQPDRAHADVRATDGRAEDEKDKRLQAVVLAVAGNDPRFAQAILAPHTLAPPGGRTDPARQQRIDLLKAAAEAGYARAQFALARQYIIGEEPQATIREAIELLRDAAARGDTDAQLLLGVIYAQGKIARRDLVEAQLYLSLAAAQGAPDTQRVIEDIERDMTLEQIIDARRIGRQYHKLLNALITTRLDGTRGELLRDELLDAAAAGNTAKIARALARGADIEAMDGAGRTAVINAAWRGRLDAIELLLGVGADIDARDGRGRTALAWAASNGHTEVVARLIGAGATVDVADADGTTALMRAAWNGHSAVVETLRAAGARADLADNGGRPALDRGPAGTAAAHRRVGT